MKASRDPTPPSCAGQRDPDSLPESLCGTLLRRSTAQAVPAGPALVPTPPRCPGPLAARAAASSTIGRATTARRTRSMLRGRGRGRRTGVQRPARRRERPTGRRLTRAASATAVDATVAAASGGRGRSRRPGLSAPSRSSRTVACTIAAGVGSLEPVERPRIAAPREDVERHARQIDSVNVRLAVRAQPIPRDPTAVARRRARSVPPGRPADRPRPAVIRSTTRLSMPRSAS